MTSQKINNTRFPIPPIPLNQDILFLEHEQGCHDHIEPNTLYLSLIQVKIQVIFMRVLLTYLNGS